MRRSAKPRPTVAMGFITGILTGYLRRGGAAAPMLVQADIDPAVVADSHQRVGLDQFVALYQAISQELDDEGFGLFAAALRRGSFELLCRGLVSSAHLEEAIQRTSRYLRVLLPDLALSVHRNGDVAELVIRETRPFAADLPEGGRVFAYEWLLRHLHGLFCWLVGRGLALDSVRFPYPRPSQAEDYTLLYTGQSDFGGDALVARFNATFLELPIRRDEAALASFLDGAPAKLTSLYRRDREIVLKVRNLLHAHLPASLDLDGVARLMHLSTRTLHRRLEEEGVSFRAIKNALRRDTALAWLAKSDKPIARIAADLGYADTSAFYRAFVGWTGMAPAHYRGKAGEA